MGHWVNAIFLFRIDLALSAFFCGLLLCGCSADMANNFSVSGDPTMKRLGSLLLSALMVCGSAVSASAEGFALFEWSARGNALGGAMIARADDASAVAFNPAGITQLPGTHLMGGMSGIVPSGKITTYSASTGVKTDTELQDNYWLIPHGYATQQLSDDLWLGMGMYTRFGLGVDYPEDWAGKYNLYHVGLKTSSFTPNLAYKVNDKLSISAGPELMYLYFETNKHTGPLGPLTENDMELKGDSYGVGGNLGIHYKFSDQWAAGISYKSQIKQKVEGQAEFGKQQSFMTVKQFDSDVHGTIVLPDEVLFGMLFKPTPKLGIEVGGVWTRWSTYRSLNFYLDDPSGIVSKTSKKWRDAWRFNLGVEYALLDWMDVRAGYTYDQSPIHDDYPDYMVPSNDRQMYSTGVGFKWDAWTLDLSYSYLTIKGRDYLQRRSPDNANLALPNDVLTGQASEGNSHIVGMSVGYSF